MTRRTTRGPKKVEALAHTEAKRANIPTAEHQSLAQRQEEMNPTAPAHYPRAHPLSAGVVRARDQDLDPQIIWNGARVTLSAAQIRQLQERGEIEIGDAQLTWRGKDRQDWSDLVVNTPPLYIQEKVHPKAIIDDLVRRSREAKPKQDDSLDLFADFNGLTDPAARTEFYQHSQHWSNRMILGDSLQVMASLAERERLKGEVQCIYFDPPYGIKFNSNWQVSTQSREVDEKKQADITREPEQVKAFRDTWRDGIHSYLTYLRDRLAICRELLHDRGSIFVQIGDENVHRVRAILDEVFGSDNFVSQISVRKTTGSTSLELSNISDFLLWYAKDVGRAKIRSLYLTQTPGEEGAKEYKRVELEDGRLAPVSEFTNGGIVTLPEGARLLTTSDISSKGGNDDDVEVWHQGKKVVLSCKPNRHWKAGGARGIERLWFANRLLKQSGLRIYKRYFSDFPYVGLTNIWNDTRGEPDPSYVVQTSELVVQRCILMTSDPGDLVLDPTCGSGTTAAVAEQWGRRWITIDTSRVALALARTRLMSSKYPYYYLVDSDEGRKKEQEVSGKVLPPCPTHSDIRLGFVSERASRITLGSIANNSEIDVIWETSKTKLDELRDQLNAGLSTHWEEWEVPSYADKSWGPAIAAVHASYWDEIRSRQQNLDKSIERKGRDESELLVDRPYVDPARIRVTGPFTVESLSPHRVVPADDEVATDKRPMKAGRGRRSKLVAPPTDFADMVLEHLCTAGVHQAEKRDTIQFTSITGWPGDYIGAEGRFLEKNGKDAHERRAAIFLGPEFGTLSRVDLAAAAREATEARFDVLIACSFNFDAHAAELTRLGPLPILKAKMNPDLHMAGELKNTGKGNLFVVFGEPDIDILDQGDETIVVKVNGIDVFDPNTGQIRSNDVKGIAAWFIDTDYNEESFFVRHAYFLGADDPYKSLKTALKAEIDHEAWQSLYRDASRPFARPSTGRIAVKVINHFGDEVMKVFTV